MNKIAYIISNSEYKNRKLTNPHKDAEAIKQSLQLCNFIIYDYKDLSSVEMYQVISNFINLHKENGTYFFYFAGHGYHSNNKNYIEPIDCSPDDPRIEGNYDYESIDLGLLTNIGTKAIEAHTILFIDACRKSDNTINQPEMNCSKNTAILYSTSPHKPAKDASRNINLSPFASAAKTSILLYLKTVPEIATIISKIVQSESAQIPIFLSTLESNVYLMDSDFLPNNHTHMILNSNAKCPYCASDIDLIYASRSTIYKLSPNGEETGYKINLIDDKICSLATHKELIAAGTTKGSLLYGKEKLVQYDNLTDDGINSIDVCNQYVAISTLSGCFLIDIVKNKKYKLCSEYSYANKFDRLEQNLCYVHNYMTVHERSNDEILYFEINLLDLKNNREQTHKSTFDLNCYDVLPLVSKNIVFIATNKGLYYWNLIDDKLNIIESCREDPFIALSINFNRDTIVAVTQSGLIQFVNIDTLTLIHTDNLRMPIETITWTNKNNLVFNNTSGELFQIFNTSPDYYDENNSLHRKILAHERRLDLD